MVLQVYVFQLPQLTPSIGDLFAAILLNLAATDPWTGPAFANEFALATARQALRLESSGLPVV